jgi:3-methyladenine DNA glycosylase AlkC
MIGFDTMDTDNYKRWAIKQQIEQLCKKVARLAEYAKDDVEYKQTYNRVENLKKDLSES